MFLFETQTAKNDTRKKSYRQKFDPNYAAAVFKDIEAVI